MWKLVNKEEFDALKQRVAALERKVENHTSMSVYNPNGRGFKEISAVAAICRIMTHLGIKFQIPAITREDVMVVRISDKPKTKLAIEPVFEDRE